MYFSVRTRRLALSVAAVVGLLFAAAMILAWLSPQRESYRGAFVWWLAWIPLGLAIWFALEWLGTHFLQQPFWQRLSSPVRVVLLVVAIVVAVSLAFAISQRLTTT